MNLGLASDRVMSRLNYTSNYNNKNVQTVLGILNESDVRYTTAIGLLEALAERLMKPFTVICKGECQQLTWRSAEYLAYAARKGESASEDSHQWLVSILGPEPNKVVFNNCYGGFGLSPEAEIWLRKHGMSEEEIDDFMWSNRHHPLLIRCVEVLGDRASGDCAKLAIAEIYSNKYRITEEDGWETVEVPDNLNWVII